MNLVPSRGASVIEGGMVQWRIIWALMLRETITRYGRRNLGFVWLFLEPILFTGAITLVWIFFRNLEAGGLEVVAFAVSGYAVLQLWRNGASFSVDAIRSNRGLLHHRRVLVIDLMYSRLIMEMAGATIALICISLAAWAAGLFPTPPMILTAIMGWGLMCWFTVGLGLVLGVVAEYSYIFGQIWRTASYLMFPISGAIFMVEWLPANMQEVLLWVPMVHGTEMVRHGIFGDRVVTHENVSYLFAWAAALNLLGLYLVRDAEFRLGPT